MQAGELCERLAALPIGASGAKGLLVLYICERDFANKTEQASFVRAHSCVPQK